MTLTRPLIAKFLVPLAVFAATLGAILLLNRSSSSTGDNASSASGALVGPGASTDAQIAALERDLADDPGDAELYAALGNTYLQKVRETGDPTFYARAENAYRQGLRRNPHDAGTLTGMGALALARHDFEGGLRYGMKAHAEAPSVVRPYGVIVDAQIELGRYGDAARSLQRMVDLKPNLASYSRVSYFRELHGDLDGALEAMRLAVAAGGDARENSAFVQTLLGNLELQRGRVGAAGGAYRLALARYPAYVPAVVGLARIEAASGRLDAAIHRYRSAIAALPAPENFVELGEAELAVGSKADGRRHLARAAEALREVARNGERVDTELALLEANHGDPAHAIVLGRRAWAAAPSVRSADALGWALTRGSRPAEGLRWAKRALRLGSADPAFLYHAGMSAKAAGHPELARGFLDRSLSRNARWSPLYAPRAGRALRNLK